MNIDSINTLVLAYLGDSVYELLIRDYFLKQGLNKVNNLQNKVTNYVSAKAQSKYVQYLIDNNYLAEDEISYYKHARNAHPHSKSKNSSIVEYRKATGLEALLGLLLYEDENRLIEVLSEIGKILGK